MVVVVDKFQNVFGPFKNELTAIKWAQEKWIIGWFVKTVSKPS